MASKTIDGFKIRLFLEETGLDLTQFVKNVFIVSSISNIYQSVIIEFHVDAGLLMLEQYVCQERISLIIEPLLVVPDSPIGLVQYRLLGLSLSSPQSLYRGNEPINFPIEEWNNSRYILFAIAEKAYEGMSKIVNRLYQTPVTPYEVVEKIFDKEFPEFINKKYMVETNTNPTLMEQCIIPPVSFHKAIKYLDDNFSIFNGPAFWFWDINEYFMMWDLSKVLNEKKPYFKVNFLTKSNNIKSKLKDLSPWGEDNDNFYTTSPIVVNFQNNQQITKHGFKHKFITKPPDELYKYVEMTLEDIFEQKSIHRENSTIKYSKADSIKNRTKVHGNNITYRDDINNTHLANKLSRLSSELTNINFTITQNLAAFRRLTFVGSPIELIPHSFAVEDYGGKYILSKSVLSFTQESQGGFTASGSFSCFRANNFDKDTPVLQRL